MEQASTPIGIPPLPTPPPLRTSSPIAEATWPITTRRNTLVPIPIPTPVCGILGAGLPFCSLDSEGNGYVTGYEMGTYDGTGFTPNNPWISQNSGTDIRSTRVKIMGASLPAPSEATKEIVIADRFGKTLRKEFWVMPQGNWTCATATTFTYPSLWADSTPKEVVAQRDGRVVAHALALSGTETVEWDEQGIETHTVTDLLGRTSQVTRVGAGGQGSIATSYGYSGRTTTATVSAGGVVRTKSTVADLAGRTVSETDQTGATTSTSYPNGGKDTQTVLPEGSPVW